MTQRVESAIINTSVAILGAMSFCLAAAEAFNHWVKRSA